MKYCTHCGAPLDEDAAFCTSCGAPVEDETAPFTIPTSINAGTPVTPMHAAVPSPSQTPYDSKSQAKQGTGTLVAIASSAAVIVIVFVVLAFTPLGTQILGHPLLSPGKNSNANNAVVAPGTSSSAPSGSNAPATADVQPRSSVNDYSWDELSQISAKMAASGSKAAAANIGAQYNLCAADGTLDASRTKSLSVGGKQVAARIVGIYHDDLADTNGKAGLTFMVTPAPGTHEYSPSDANAGGWSASEIRSWLGSSELSALPQDLSSKVVAVKKLTNNVGRTMSTSDVTATNDKLWLFSVVEVAGPIDWQWDSDASNSRIYNSIMNTEGEQYEAFAHSNFMTDQANAGLCLAGNAGDGSWWLRSTSPSKDKHFRCVWQNGDPSCFGKGPDQRAVVFGFCL